MAKKTKKGLDGRHRDTTGRIDKKHGNTRVKALRKTYGEHFAKGRRGDMMLKTLLVETGTESLHAYLPSITSNWMQGRYLALSARRASLSEQQAFLNSKPFRTASLG
jgi:hypothetical protein